MNSKHYSTPEFVLKISEKFYLPSIHSFFLTATLLLITLGERTVQTVTFSVFTAGFTLLLRHPESLAAAVHALPFLGAFTFGGVTVLIILLGLMAVVICWHLFRRPSQLFNLPSLMTLLFFTYLIINWYFSNQPDFDDGAGKLRLYFIRGVMPLVLILSLKNATSRFQSFLFSWVSFSFLISVMIVTAYFGLSNMTGTAWGNSERISLLGIDPISISLPIGISGIILVHFFMQATKTKYKIYLALLFTFMFFAIFLTGSRQTLLAMAIGIIIYTYFIRDSHFSKIRIFILTTFVLSIIFIFIYNSSNNERYNILSSGYMQNESFTGRIESINLGLTTFNKYPFFGVGLGGHGNYIHTTNPYSGVIVTDKEHIHNLFIELLAEQGIFGFFLFISPVLISLVRLIKILNHPNNFRNKRQYAILMISLFFFAIFQSNISGGIAVSGSFLTFLVGWASILNRNCSHEPLSPKKVLSVRW